jgi:hypothetical protein
LLPSRTASLLLACAATLLVSNHSQAAIISDFTATYAYSGQFQSETDSKSGSFLTDGSPNSVQILLSGSESMSFNIGASFQTYIDEADIYFNLSISTIASSAIGASLNFSLTTVVTFNLEFGGSGIMDYYPESDSVVYVTTLNGKAITGGSLAFQQGLNTFVFTADFTTDSLDKNLYEYNAGDILIAPDAVPEPRSWVFTACGTGVGLLLARRKLSRAQA